MLCILWCNYYIRVCVNLKTVIYGIKINDNYDKLNKYKDATNVSTWAKNSVEGVLEQGYMNGYSDNTFRPKNNITRAEAVVTLSRIKK